MNTYFLIWLAEAVLAYAISGRSYSLRSKSIAFASAIVGALIGGGTIGMIKQFLDGSTTLGNTWKWFSFLFAYLGSGFFVLLAQTFFARPEIIETNRKNHKTRTRIKDCWPF